MNPENSVNNLVVCKYFLRCEFSKGTFHSDPSSYTDEDVLREMTAFGQQISNNPAVVWLGFSPTESRPEVTWKYVRDIDVHILFSKGLNQEWIPHLQAVNWNLFRFVTECQTIYRSEYELTRLPSADLSLIIGIVDPRNPNKIELVDGSHRLASMILNNVRSVEGYIGF